MLLLHPLPTPPTLDKPSHHKDSDWPVQRRKWDLSTEGLTYSTWSCSLWKTSCAFIHQMPPDKVACLASSYKMLFSLTLEATSA